MRKSRNKINTSIDLKIYTPGSYILGYEKITMKNKIYIYNNNQLRMK